MPLTSLNSAEGAAEPLNLEQLFLVLIESDQSGELEFSISQLASTGYKLPSEDEEKAFLDRLQKDGKLSKLESLLTGLRAIEESEGFKDLSADIQGLVSGILISIELRTDPLWQKEEIGK